MCALKHIIMGGMTMGWNCNGKHASYNAGGGQQDRWYYNVSLHYNARGEA